MIFILTGAILGFWLGILWWVKFCLLGFAVLLTLRTVVFLTVSSSGSLSNLIAIILPPFAYIAPFIVFWTILGVPIFAYIPFLLIAPVIACGAALFFVRIIDRIGRKTYNLSSMALFKAFIVNWVAGLNAPLEDFLEKLGDETDIMVDLLKFGASTPKLAIIVPLVHPGPFKNIGSSPLPSLLKQEYEKEHGGDACVPLGLLGHELDAASQSQNYKIINKVLSSASSPDTIENATPFVRYSEDFVSASCQIFGKTAFLSLTLAPKTTEDLPMELGEIIREEAKKLGLDSIVVNAHNSLTENTAIEASLETLRRVAVKCINKAVSMGKKVFEVGSFTIHPPVFSLEDGMGAGGITAIVVRVGVQKTVYVVIDGNNMVSGLRERILTMLGSEGFEEREVFTTDTHAVSAVVVGRRGYHPVGEAMNHEALMKYIKDAALRAQSNLEGCRASFQRILVSKVRVIGGDCLSLMSVLVDKSIQKAKRTVAPIFGLEGLLLILFLIIL